MTHSHDYHRALKKVKSAYLDFEYDGFSEKINEIASKVDTRSYKRSSDFLNDVQAVFHFRAKSPGRPSCWDPSRESYSEYVARGSVVTWYSQKPALDHQALARWLLGEEM